MVIDDVEHPDHTGGDDPVHRVDLPPLVRRRSLLLHDDFGRCLG